MEIFLKKMKQLKIGPDTYTIHSKNNIMSDWMKPQFKINSLDKQNNDPLKTGSIDSYSGATDNKPLPSQTLMGTIGIALPKTN